MSRAAPSKHALNIIDRPIARNKLDIPTVSLSAFAYLFSELISYAMDRAASITELEDRWALALVNTAACVACSVCMYITCNTGASATTYSCTSAARVRMHCTRLLPLYSCLLLWHAPVLTTCTLEGKQRTTHMQSHTLAAAVHHAAAAQHCVVYPAAPPPTTRTTTSSPTPTHAPAHSHIRFTHPGLTG
jgi:hypothetical protein